MNQRSIFTAFAACVLSIICFTTASAQGNGTQVTTYPVNVTIYNPCCDEWVTFTGTVHSILRSVVNADGTITDHFQSTVSGIRGTGLSSGITYNGHERNSGTATFNPVGPGPFTLDQTIKTTMTGRGKNGRACTANFTLTVHVIVDADGNLVIESVVPTVDCANGNTIQ